jgi:tripartite-type tricarboxylate transporter receptor subunit TctC
MNLVKHLQHGATTVLATILPLLAIAQDFPSKPVKVIVPQAPGAGTDLIARVIINKLADKWKQPIVVENRAGANGIIGSQQLVASAPDGYTLLIQGATHVTNQFAQKYLPYDTVKSFTPLGLIATSPYVLAASPQSGAASLQQVLVDVRNDPNRSSIGVGDNSTRLIGGVIGVRAKTQIQTIPYKSGAPMLTDLMGGHIPFGISSVSSTYSAHRSGKIRIVAVLNSERSQALPTIPTASEQGLPGAFPTYWFGLFGPAHMDRALADKISKDFAEVLSSPEIRSRFIDIGIDPVGSTRDQFDARIKADLKLWGDLIAQTGLRMDQ